MLPFGAALLSGGERVCPLFGMLRGTDRCVRPLTTYPFQAAKPRRFFSMATPSCLIADERYSYSIALQRSTSSRSSLVHVPGGDEVEIRVNTDLFVHHCTMFLEVEEELPTDVVLGFDWFGSFAEQACEHECWYVHFSGRQ